MSREKLEGGGLGWQLTRNGNGLESIGFYENVASSLLNLKLSHLSCILKDLLDYIYFKEITLNPNEIKLKCNIVN